MACDKRCDAIVTLPDLGSICERRIALQKYNYYNRQSMLPKSKVQVTEQITEHFHTEVIKK